MATDNAKRYIIRHPNGTYYQRDTAIGPQFGATREEARGFFERRSAEWMLGDWRFAGCDIEEKDDDDR